MIVCCVNAGNYCGRGKEYVLNLYRMVSDNTTIAFDFQCFTDDKDEYPPYIKKRELPSKRVKGWFNKLYLFSDSAFNKGERVFYFDLDTVITSNIDDILQYNGKFAMLAPYRRGASKQSGIMSWIHGDFSEIWKRFCSSGFKEVGGGDQEIINDIVKNADLFQKMFPEKMYSFKVNHGIFPSTSSIILFNNRPKPHELMNTWIKNYYQPLQEKKW